VGSAADDIAAGIIAKWSAAFARLDADALSSLYSKHALFYGSNPTLYRGRDGVKSYFTGLPRWNSQSVRFTDVSTDAAGADLANMAGTANFSIDGAPLTVKITWVIVREDGDWKIVSHHVSSKAPLIDP
jgi:ketosteroid isomerase-like protein